MIALMTLWFGRYASLPADSGYFYLCPECYGRYVEPHMNEVLNRLVEQHPFLHRLRAGHEVERPTPARQAGALPAHREAASSSSPAESESTGIGPPDEAQPAGSPEDSRQAVPPTEPDTPSDAA